MFTGFITSVMSIAIALLVGVFVNEQLQRNLSPLRGRDGKPRRRWIDPTKFYEGKRRGAEEKDPKSHVWQAMRGKAPEEDAIHCHHEGCKLTPYYEHAISHNRYCEEHRRPGMNDVFHKWCSVHILEEELVRAYTALVLHKVADPELKHNGTHKLHDLNVTLAAKMSEWVSQAFKKNIAESERLAAESIERLRAATYIPRPAAITKLGDAGHVYVLPERFWQVLRDVCEDWGVVWTGADEGCRVQYTPILKYCADCRQSDQREGGDTARRPRGHTRNSHLRGGRPRRCRREGMELDAAAATVRPTSTPCSASTSSCTVSRTSWRTRNRWAAWAARWHCS